MVLGNPESGSQPVGHDPQAENQRLKRAEQHSNVRPFNAVPHVVVTPNHKIIFIATS